MFKIISESAISAGVRRIEAVTGAKAENAFYAVEDIMRDMQQKIGNPNLVQAIAKLIEQNSTLAAQVDAMRKEQIENMAKRIAENVSDFDRDGVVTIAKKMEMPADVIKDLAFNLKGRISNLVFVAGSEVGGKPSLSIMLGDEIVARGVNAGEIVRAAAKEIQGGGGGQAFFATAGGKNPAGLESAIAKAVELINEKLK